MLLFTVEKGGCFRRADGIKRLQSGLMAAAPRHPVLRESLNMLWQNYGRGTPQHVLSAVGPGLVYDAFAKILVDPLSLAKQGRATKPEWQDKQDRGWTWLQEDSEVYVGEDLSPIMGLGKFPKFPDVLLLLDANGYVWRSVYTKRYPEGGIIPVAQHKYKGWNQEIQQIGTGDDKTWISGNGTCLRRFR